MQFPFPALVVDIGGTNVRIAGMAAPGAALSPPVHCKTGDFAGLAEAILAADLPMEKPRSVIACGAGPVVGQTLQLTNAPWLINGPAVARKLGLSQGLLLNDFEAQALSLPAIRPEWTLEIGPALPLAEGPKVILGPGTGLGIGALIEVSGRYVALASEASHLDFGPQEADEWAVFPHLERAHGRISTESVMSGPGLARLHRARMASLGLPVPVCDGASVGELASADAASQAAETVRLFWRQIARFAGDMAITYLATGGVTLAGGILPRLAGLLDPVAFRRAFEAKAPVDALARRIGVRLVTAPDVVLAGMAAIARAPERYELDYAARGWCRA